MRENAVKQPAKSNAKSAAPARRAARTKGSRNQTSSNSDRQKSAKRSASARDRAMAKASGLAYEAAGTVYQAASNRASSVSRQVAGMLDNQVAAGAGVISQFAHSTRLAADDLEATAPQVAGVVRSVASRIDDYAETIKDQSVEQIVASASGFTRRQPAVVFGLGALVGFLLFRTLRSAPDHAGRPARASRNGA